GLADFIDRASKASKTMDVFSFEKFRKESLNNVIMFKVDTFKRNLNDGKVDQKRVELFESMFKDIFLDKAVTVSKAGGISITGKGTRTKNLLPFLSSGEKNLLIIFLTSIFETGEGWTVLIDEPENSLHVGWQIRFIEYLQAVHDALHVNFILATHSPSIVHDRLDLCTSMHDNTTTRTRPDDEE
nr:AAA family ATPase [Candidatus Sigynarchaeota archaeon]